MCLLYIHIYDEIDCLSVIRVRVTCMYRYVSSERVQVYKLRRVMGKRFFFFFFFSVIVRCDYVRRARRSRKFVVRRYIRPIAVASAISFHLS